MCSRCAAITDPGAGAGPGSVGGAERCGTARRWRRVAPCGPSAALGPSPWCGEPSCSHDSSDPHQRSNLEEQVGISLLPAHLDSRPGPTSVAVHRRSVLRPVQGWTPRLSSPSASHIYAAHSPALPLLHPRRLTSPRLTSVTSDITNRQQQFGESAEL